MLEKNFKQLSKNFSPKTELINQLWIEIINAHNTPKRYYHTLKHLANIDQERQNIKLSFEDDAIFQFATYYHDIVYDVEAKDNEE
jgi:predicted metal-dependent HD superfamily phosphohydrolase